MDIPGRCMDVLAARRRRCGWCTSGSATSSARIRRGTPTAPATAGGSPRSAGAAPGLAEALSAQDGLYTLVTRAPDGDRRDVISSLARAYPAARHDAWLATVASPDVRAMTITITEAGYAGARADADVAALRADPTAPVRTRRRASWRGSPPAGARTRARSP